MNSLYDKYFMKLIADAGTCHWSGRYPRVLALYFVSGGLNVIFDKVYFA
jgi:hypothetical protein